MRRLIGFIFITMLLSVVIVACSSNESYADKLKNEQKEIEKFLSENDIKVLDEMPKVGYTFAKNEYYKDPSGTYIRVINWGDQDYMATTTPRRTSVSIRFTNGRFLGDTVLWTTTGSGADFVPIEIEYGDANTYAGSSSGTDPQIYKYMFMSISCVLPLEYVGNKGEVSLLVPFVNGSVYQRSTVYRALYFEKMRYTFLD